MPTFLDKTGLTTLWSTIKSYVDSGDSGNAKFYTSYVLSPEKSKTYQFPTNAAGDLPDFVIAYCVNSKGSLRGGGVDTAGMREWNGIASEPNSEFSIALGSDDSTAYVTAGNSTMKILSLLSIYTS